MKMALNGPTHSQTPSAARIHFQKHLPPSGRLHSTQNSRGLARIGVTMAQIGVEMARMGVTMARIGVKSALNQR